MYMLEGSSQLVSVLDVGMVQPFAMVNVRPESLREHQASLLSEELADVVDRSCGRVLLRFSEGAEVCASCLSELIRESQRAEALGGRIFIVGLSREMRRMLKGTGLDRQLHLARDTAEAMKHFDRRQVAAA
ncbi:MAG: hypothetical protein IPJ41_03800 [Phycisphaerales bacterium]|nr:hypothetical protein [Phycisphaerales bacterium]